MFGFDGVRAPLLIGACAGLSWACGSRSPAPSTAEDVFIDGSLEEWVHVAPILVDPADAPQAAVDLRELRARDDGAWLFLALDWERPANAQALRGLVSIMLDADGDPATGSRIEDLDGVDLIVELSRQDGPRPDGYGTGVGLRPVTADGPGALQPGRLLDLVVAPTFAQRSFELRLRRAAVLPGVPALFEGELVRAQLILEDREGVQDRTDVGTYRLSTPPSSSPEHAPIETIRKEEELLRVLAWNVSGRTGRDRSTQMGRVLAALMPDVVLFDEVWPAVTVAEIQAVLAAVPGERSWNVHIARGGGRQKTVVASRAPVRAVEHMSAIRYPDGALDSLARVTGMDTARVRMEDTSGLAATGAWVGVGAREILFVPFDLQSAGYDGSWEDHLRTLQASILSESVRQAGGGAMVVLGGDANLVGSETPLLILESGGLERADLFRLTDRTLATWRNPFQDQFSPGRLDFLVYGGDGLELVRGFVFEPSELDPQARLELGLRDNDGWVSDHLPVVGDFRVR